jgi:hypothetical protein
MKLLEDLKAVNTGGRRHIIEPLHTIKYTSTPTVDYKPRFATEYAITITLGTNQWIEEDLIQASGGAIIKYAVEKMKHDLIEHIYGELRKDLRELHLELRNEAYYMNSASLKKLDTIIAKISP